MEQSTTLGKESYECICGNNNSFIIAEKAILCDNCGRSYLLVHGLVSIDSFNAQRKYYMVKDDEAE
jgi:DNA-directed RNA polymerase subunit RPC12/RpoP